MTSVSRKASARQARSGMTLIEVLVAIFVMGIGLIALLALFPIGVLRMAQAIQDGRTGHIAKNADAVAAAKGARTDAQLNFIPPGGFLGTGPFDYFKYPKGPVWPAPYTADDAGQSFPVFVDPIGYQSNTGPVANVDWVPRRTLSFATTAAQATRWFMFLDDIYFNTDGTVGSAFEREYRYQWAYMLQRPTASNTSIVDLKVVVYKNRPPLVAGSTERLYAAKLLEQNVVRIDWSAVGTYPQVRPGEWLLDVTLMPVAGVANKSSRADFHRVVAMKDSSTTEVDIEVQTPFPSGNVNLQIVVMEGVAEVFRRGTGR
ncbi:MAG: prepilin-type N-terminal cleavage/methylation domain-containing protein [Planctomycetes bacterium]|nr:prepilin-type N-terminal cleavage/methylation domain-containing protein [Planctomycetota bacterium]